MAGKLTPALLGTFNLNDGTIYRSRFLADSGVGDVFTGREVIVELLGEFPQYVRSQPEGKTLVIRTTLLQRTLANLRTLKQAMDPSQDELRLLVSDEAGGGLELSVKPVTMRAVEGTDWQWDLVFWVSRPVWRWGQGQSASQTVTSSGQTWQVTSNGSGRVRPTVKITPNATKAQANAPLWAVRCIVANRSPLPLVDANGNPYPVDITGGGWDINPAIDSYDVHPQGYDLRVLVNGVEVPRYLSNWGAGFGDTTAASAHNLVTTTLRFAMRFRLPGCSERETNTIVSAAMVMSKTGAPAGTFTLQIAQDAAGAPGTVIATSDAVDVTSVPTTPGWVQATFSTSPTLTAHTWYWLIVNPSGLTTVDSTNYISIRSQLNGYYEGERDPMRQSTDGGSTWTLPASLMGRSACFRVRPGGNAKVWVPMLLPAAVRVTLAQALLDTDTTMVVTDASSLPPSGCLLIEDEAVIYSAIDGLTLTLAKRGARQTTAAAHSAGVVAYLVDVDVVMVYGQRAANTLPKPWSWEPPEQRPIIDGVTSTNERLRWIGPYLAPNQLRRPLAWVPSYEDMTADGDPVPQAARISLDGRDLASGGDASLLWQDSRATGTYMKRNTVRQQFPTGIRVSANAITYDIPTVADTLALQHLLTNEWGEEKVVKTDYRQHQGTGRTITPDDEAFVYALRCTAAFVVGTSVPSTVLSRQLSSDSAAETAQTFRLLADTTITAISLYLRRTTTFTGNKEFVIVATDQNGAPNQAAELSERIAVTSGDLTTSFQWVYKALTEPIRLPAGQYAILALAGTVDVVVWGGSQSSIYAGGQRWQETANQFLAQNDDLLFRIQGFTSDPESTSETGDTLEVRNIDVLLDTSRTPRVLMASSISTYYLDATLANTTTSQSVRLRAVLQPSETLSIDFDAGTVTHSSSDLARADYWVAIVDQDERDPFRLNPGANTLQWTEPGVTNTAVQLQWRDRFL
ncbi:MAG TPA: hypothetical protein VNI78_04730 [Vicinamibacterales bacterium]|nr:hypothetical protein [Vicinamibacterales bacterium]